MAISGYKNALTRMRNFTLGGGYIAGMTSGKILNPETGERRQATDALMARSPTVGDTKNIQESMELTFVFCIPIAVWMALKINERWHDDED